MLIRDLEFIGSFEKESQCPTTELPEYAFIGRSNVGKSSLINMLLERRDIARISSTPGKTQTLNYYKINDEWYIVDLPGYGYAKISKSKRKKWRNMIETYLKSRSHLYCVFVLIDGRHSLQKIDREFIDWLGQQFIPFSIVYTKMDKVKVDMRQENIDNIRNALLEDWEELPREFSTSAIEREGREEIIRFVEEINNN